MSKEEQRSDNDNDAWSHPRNDCKHNNPHVHVMTLTQSVARKFPSSSHHYGGVSSESSPARDDITHLRERSLSFSDLSARVHIRSPPERNTSLRERSLSFSEVSLGDYTSIPSSGVENLANAVQNGIFFNNSVPADEPHLDPPSNTSRRIPTLEVAYNSPADFHPPSPSPQPIGHSAEASLQNVPPHSPVSTAASPSKRKRVVDSDDEDSLSLGPPASSTKTGSSRSSLARFQPTLSSPRKATATKPNSNSSSDDTSDSGIIVISTKTGRQIPKITKKTSPPARPRRGRPRKVQFTEQDQTPRGVRVLRSASKRTKTSQSKVPLKSGRNKDCSAESESEIDFVAAPSRDRKAKAPKSKPFQPKPDSKLPSTSQKPGDSSGSDSGQDVHADLATGSDSEMEPLSNNPVHEEDEDEEDKDEDEEKGEGNFEMEFSEHEEHGENVAAQDDDDEDNAGVEALIMDNLWDNKGPSHPVRFHQSQYMRPYFLQRSLIASDSQKLPLVGGKRRCSTRALC
jgi:hypothetical protein